MAPMNQSYAEKGRIENELPAFSSLFLKQLLFIYGLIVMAAIVITMDSPAEMEKF
jgi:hypothetical protein